MVMNCCVMGCHNVASKESDKRVFKKKNPSRNFNKGRRDERTDNKTSETVAPRSAEVERPHFRNENKADTLL
jgi:hypothetical protein